MAVINPQHILNACIVQGEGAVVQQNGIDLTVRSIEKIRGYNGFLGKDDSDMPTRVGLNKNKKGHFELNRGYAYSITTNQIVKVPENMCAMILQRSTLNRMGIFTQTGLYDSGFEGRIGFTLYCFNPIKIEAGARIAQIIFMEAEAASQYEGQYSVKNLKIT